ncbi:MAG: EAL domain-containing protein, partial [Cetobacterium sp.]
GVIKDSVESNFARDFYKNGEIQDFDDYDALEKALNANRVSAILLFDISSLDTSKFIVNDFMKISIVLGFDKENFILRDIFNKWLENTSNLNKIIENSEMIKKQDAFNEYQKFKIINRVLYILLSIFSFTLIISFIKIYLNEKITNELKKDSLTGLPNRKEFLNFILNNKKLEGYAITIDIDNFKELNDRYGETIGDNVLKIVSQSIQNVFKKEEIYKVAGDEFNIFFEELDIIERLEKLKKEIKILNTLYCLNLSIGYYKNKDENLERAFEYATMGMEEAKKKNGTNYLEGTEELLKRKKRENSIKSILRSQNLSGLYAIYQPKFSIKTKKIVGAESLARWQDSNLGFISPLEFINIAEKIDLIYLIDFEIATQAIKFIKYLKEKELVDNEFIISFNLSMKTLEREDVVTKIKDLISKNEVLGSWLEVEITESIFSTNLKVTLEKLEELKSLGISLAMDDFTAGHSTVSLLPLLPLDVVKFDKAILDSIGTKDDIVASNIYSTLIQLVKALKFQVVAEGIETDLQLKFLEKISVDVGQGYIFSKPISNIEFETKLKNKYKE